MWQEFCLHTGIDQIPRRRLGFVGCNKNNHQRNKTIGGKQAAYKMPRARRAQKRKNYLDTCLIMTTGRDGRREKKRERVKTQEGNGSTDMQVEKFRS